MIYIKALIKSNNTVLNKEWISERTDYFRNASEELLEWGTPTAVVTGEKDGGIELAIIIPNEWITDYDVKRFAADFVKDAGAEDTYVDRFYDVGHDQIMFELKNACDESLGPDINSICDKYKTPYEYKDRRCSELMMNLGSEDADSEIQLVSQYLECAPLVDEIKRIYKVKNKEGIQYNPVHYSFETNSESIRRAGTRALVESLTANGRLFTRRVGKFRLTDYDSSNEAMEITLEDFYHEYEGSALILDASDDDAEFYIDEHAREIAETIHEYSDKVLTILILPEYCSHMKDCLNKEMYGIRIIPLTAWKVSGEKVKEFIKEQCGKQGVTVSSKSLEKVDDQRQYEAGFAYAFINRLKSQGRSNKIYPQYKDIMDWDAFRMSAELAEEEYVEPQGSSASERLERMVGLSGIKESINRIVKRIEVENVVKQRGIVTEDFPKNFIFTGNPGVAKTTVAQILSDMLYEKKIISRGGLVTAGRSSVIGAYAGETTNNMKKKLKAAKGKVLLIDEAYSLVEKWASGSSYGQEAIDTLVEELGRPEPDRVIILAGYPEPMKKFIDANPGLKSRFNFVINFPDYSEEELFDILRAKAEDACMHIADGVKDEAMPVIRDAMQKKNFGNGRFIMNYLENAISAQRERIYSEDLSVISDEELQTLIPEDFRRASMPDLNSLELNEHKKVGFC